MKFFKKRTEPVEEGPKCIKTYRIYEIRKEWVDYAGAEIYVLYWGDKQEYDDGTSYVHSNYPMDTYHAGMLPVLREDVHGRYEQVQGDKEWAKRTAEHYGIEIPDEVKQ